MIGIDAPSVNWRALTITYHRGNSLMSNLTVFTFESQDVRFVNGKPVANDVAAVLGYADPAKTVSTKVKAKYKGVTDLVTPGGIQSVMVLEEAGIYQLIFSSKLESAEKFRDWVFEEVLPSIQKTGSYGQPEQAKPALMPVTDETVKVHIQGIKYLTDNGDLKLAQLLKVQFGNRMLAEQQNLLKPVDVPQYEGVVEVAIRLGFSVPPNYESALGSHVAKQLKHLSPGHNQRYSGSSSTVIAANMYPVNHPEVEKLVLDYCVSKSFYRRDINLLG